jgi:TRAP transporter TAXI family solute receptor
MSFDDFSKVERLSGPQASDYMIDNRIDAMIFTTTPGSAYITNTATMTDVGCLEIKGELADKIIKRYPQYVKVTIPGGTYKGIDKDVETVAILAMLTTHDQMPDKYVYNIVKGIFENLDIIHGVSPILKQVQLESALRGMTIPLHPGAIKFYKEKGISIPENLIPPK